MGFFKSEALPLTESDQLHILREAFINIGISKTMPAHQDAEEELAFYLSTPQATYLILNDHYRCYRASKAVRGALDKNAESLGFNLAAHGVSSRDFFEELISFEAAIRPLTHNVSLDTILAGQNLSSYSDFVNALVRYETSLSGVDEKGWAQIKSTFAEIDKVLKEYKSR